MATSFSSDDLRRLSRSFEVLLTPFDHPSVDAWRSAVNKTLSGLLGADSAGFLLPAAGATPLYSDEHDADSLARYVDYPPPPLVNGRPLWDVLLARRVGRLVDLYEGSVGTYTRSAYYQEYAGANGAHDTLAAAFSLGGADARGAACLHFWHANPRGRRFGEREALLLEALYPAFRAGTEAQARWGSIRTGLVSALDALGHAVLVSDLQGTVIHRTPALEESLDTDPEAQLLLGAMTEAASAAGRVYRRGRAAAWDATQGTVTRSVVTGLARYTANACLAEAPMPGGSGPLVLVSLRRDTPIPRSDGELRASYRLTPAECRVAHLIARGMANADIAKELHISPFTARRHTERILLKMDVRSRSEVAARLLR